MNREDVIRMALEAGFCHDINNGIYLCAPMHIERFAALVASASEEKWKQAVISELVCCHIYNPAHDNDPRKALHDAISWNVQVALDPQVSSDAQALIDRGAAAEREACAEIAFGMAHSDEEACEVSAAIRARGQA